MTSKEALKRIKKSHSVAMALLTEGAKDEETENAIRFIEEDLKRLEKLEKAIDILKGRICVHNGYVCYDVYADIKLKDDECELLKEVLGDENNINL